MLPSSARRRATLGAGVLVLAALPAAQAVAADCAALPTAEIGEVQGAGGATPLAGQQVTVRGVVVADLPGFSGFSVQDPDGDGDEATSDGVFVYSPVPVALGDDVAVTGEAQEFNGQTQVSAPAGVTVCASGTALPAPAALDLPADDTTRERLEGMLVEPADVLTVSDVFDLVSFGELTLSEGGVLVQPTEVARPGPAAQAVALYDARRALVLDDGTSARVSVTTRPYLSPATPVRVGDAVAFTEPVVLGWGFGQWRLQPADGTAAGVFAAQDTRPGAPDDVGGDLRIGAFNVLNYFLTRSGPDARGARTDAEFEEQAAKVVAAIDGLGADVVTLLEVEDTDSTGLSPGDADRALADLTGRLTGRTGEEWAYLPLPAELYGVERDAIRNAIVYRPAAVTPVGDPVGLVDEAVWGNAREPVAQGFSAGGEVVTVVANHFKSKGSAEGATGDNADTGDGQGAWNGDRVRQARSLAGFVEDLAVTDPDVVVLGDLNAYTREDPVEALRAAGLTELGERFDPGRYSYVFDGRSGSLDHALATPSLTARVTGLAHWNVNAVESSAYQYDGDPALYAPDPYRSSDHDPLVLGVDLGAEGLAAGGDPPGTAPGC
ncbi:ExeM/NucH family extracellular endonuclease [Geodermatophilus sp. SYSU D00697]